MPRICVTTKRSINYLQRCNFKSIAFYWRRVGVRFPAQRSTPVYLNTILVAAMFHAILP